MALLTLFCVALILWIARLIRDVRVLRDRVADLTDHGELRITRQQRDHARAELLYARQRCDDLQIENNALLERLRVVDPRFRNRDRQGHFLSRVKM